MKEKYEEIISFLRGFQERAHVNGYVLGISGGKDSTIVAKLLVDAIGKENVLGVLMPNGEQKGINDSIQVCNVLGIDYQVVNIKDSFDAVLRQIMHTNHPNFPGDENYKGTTEVQCSTYYVTEKAKTNISPRLRMLTLYAISQSLGYLVAGTGNASERFIGWFTKWGDGACDINPIAHLTCTEVIKLGDYLGLPYELVHKTPADGLTGKSDEENFGFTYQELDCLVEKTKRLNLTGHLISPFTDIEKDILKIHDNSFHKFAPITLCKDE